MSDLWGEDITIITGSDFRFLPGVYALFNSAVSNGFTGQFKILAGDDLDADQVPKHPQLSVFHYPRVTKAYTENVKRLEALRHLPDGRYLFLDADVIIERPCGHLLEALDEGMLVSSEPEQRYDYRDVQLYRQCKALGLSTDLEPMPYVNCGVVGFSLPRDREMVLKWADLSFQHTQGMLRYCHYRDWFFLEQDVLNVLVRQKGAKVFTLSPRVVELSALGTHFRERPFPFQKQGELSPADQTKYIIHGAALRRPWLKPRRKFTNWKTRLIDALEPLGIGPWWRKPYPYERGWAYYACAPDMPIPLTAWAKQHDFTAHQHRLWRRAHGLDF